MQNLRSQILEDFVEAGSVVSVESNLKAHLGDGWTVFNTGNTRDRKEYFRLYNIHNREGKKRQPAVNKPTDRAANATHAVLNREQVASIKYLLREGTSSGKIRALFDISVNTLSDIRVGRTWADVD